MEKHINEIQNIFRQVLENSNLVINAKTCSDDIEEWDSLNHIYLIVEIESFYKLKFTSRQIQEWENVGDMINEIIKMK